MKSEVEGNLEGLNSAVESDAMSEQNSINGYPAGIRELLGGEGTAPTSCKLGPEPLRY